MNRRKCEYGHYYPEEYNKNCIYCRDLKKIYEENNE